MQIGWQSLQYGKFSLEWDWHQCWYIYTQGHDYLSHKPVWLRSIILKVLNYHHDRWLYRNILLHQSNTITTNQSTTNFSPASLLSTLMPHIFNKRINIALQQLSTNGNTALLMKWKNGWKQILFIFVNVVAKLITTINNIPETYVCIYRSYNPSQLVLKITVLQISNPPTWIPG